MLICVQHPTESVTSSNVKGRVSVRSRERHGQWLVRAGVRDALVRRQVCTHRSMIEFILGIRTPLRTVSMPASARMASNRAGNFPSRSLIRYRARVHCTTARPHQGIAQCVSDGEHDDGHLTIADLDRRPIHRKPPWAP
jgi:hypothetical protein